MQQYPKICTNPVSIIRFCFICKICYIIRTQLSECLEKWTPLMLFKSHGKVMENSLNKKLAFNLYEPWTLASQVLSNFPSESIT